jgi:hypothetical protein
MIIKHVGYYTDRLQQKNYKSFYLSFLRVAISIWLLKEVVINWPAMDILYGPSTFVTLKSNLISRIPGGGLTLVRTYYLWVIVTYIIVILLNILGIGRWFTGLLLFLMVDFLEKMNTSFVNGGDKMVRLILLYMIFANSYQYFVLYKNKKEVSEKGELKNLISNLAALSIMLQLCVAYFGSGIAKINDAFWLNGEATYYALSMERFVGTSLNKYIVQQKWIDYLTNYGTIIFELFFPILIWIKRIRKPLLIIGVVFHMCIYIFMMIYGFEIVFILIYGLFLPNKMLVDFSQRIKSFFWKGEFVKA